MFSWLRWGSSNDADDDDKRPRSESSSGPGSVPASNYALTEDETNNLANLGVTDAVIEFVEEIARRPETWIDFPFDEEMELDPQLLARVFRVASSDEATNFTLSSVPVETPPTTTVTASESVALSSTSPRERIRRTTSKSLRKIKGFSTDILTTMRKKIAEDSDDETEAAGIAASATLEDDTSKSITVHVPLEKEKSSREDSRDATTRKEAGGTATVADPAVDKPQVSSLAEEEAVGTGSVVAAAAVAADKQSSIAEEEGAGGTGAAAAPTAVDTPQLSSIAVEEVAPDDSNIEAVEQHTEENENAGTMPASSPSASTAERSNRPNSPLEEGEPVSPASEDAQRESDDTDQPPKTQQDIYTLTPRQVEHAIIMLKRSPALRELRYRMCPRFFDEDRFWKIYFMLVSGRLGREQVDLLSERPAPQSNPVQAHPDDLSMWEFVVSSGEKGSKDFYSEKWEEVANDEAMYKNARWVTEDIADDSKLLQLIRSHRLRVLMRTGVPLYIDGELRERVWMAAVGFLPPFNVTGFEDAEERTFGPHVPCKCVRVPSFNGWYRPDEYADLPRSARDAASRLLVMIALEDPTASHIPALPDLCLMLLRSLDIERAWAVVRRMLSESRRSGATSLAENSSAPTEASSGAPQPVFYIATSREEDRECLVAFAELMRRGVPRVFNHILKINLVVADFASVWFGRLFVSVVPMNTVIRIFDWFLSEGMPVLHAVGLALLQIYSANLLSCETGEEFLKNLKLCARSHTKDEQLIQTAIGFRVTRGFLSRLFLRLQPSVTDAASTKKKSGKLRKKSSSSSYRALSKVVNARGRALSLAQQGVVFYRPRMIDLSSIITQEQMEIIWSWLPNPYRLMDPRICFSTNTHGCSLTNLYKCLDETDSEASLLVVKTREGCIFGAFLSRHLEPQSKETYYGSGETFVFRTQPDMRRYSWKPGQAELFILATRETVRIGGAAIMLDDELHEGRSERGETFDNPSLLGEDLKQFDFEAVLVESWTFLVED